MSRVIDAIKTEQCNRAVLKEPLRFTTTASNVQHVPYMDAYEYKFSVTFEACASCAPKDWPRIKYDAKRAIVEEIFGEFRSPIMAIYEALFNRDVEKAAKALTQLEHRLFDVGPEEL